MSQCPCGSKNAYETCCGLYIEKKQKAQTPEQLMRSRYTAYTLGQIDYIKSTMKGKALLGFNELSATQWAKNVQWIGLEVISTSMSTPDIGFVSFVARFSEHHMKKELRELSEFHRENGCWFYVNSVNKVPKSKTARNAPCHCGSGKKFKNCHAEKE